MGLWDMVQILDNNMESFDSSIEDKINIQTVSKFMSFLMDCVL